MPGAAARARDPASSHRPSPPSPPSAPTPSLQSPAPRKTHLHDDVSAQPVLDGHALLRRQQHAAAVHGRLELDAALGDVSEVQQRHHLEAAAVRQHAARPVYEAVQAAHRRDEVRAGVVAEVVGVAQDDVAVQLLQLLGGQALDGALGGRAQAVGWGRGGVGIGQAPGGSCRGPRAAARQGARALPGAWAGTWGGAVAGLAPWWHGHGFLRRCPWRRWLQEGQAASRRGAPRPSHLGADWHEHGRLDDIVRQRHERRARAPLLREHLQGGGSGGAEPRWAPRRCCAQWGMGHAAMPPPRRRTAARPLTTPARARGPAQAARTWNLSAGEDELGKPVVVAMASTRLASIGCWPKQQPAERSRRQRAARRLPRQDGTAAAQMLAGAICSDCSRSSARAMPRAFFSALFSDHSQADDLKSMHGSAVMMANAGIMHTARPTRQGCLCQRRASPVTAPAHPADAANRPRQGFYTYCQPHEDTAHA